MHIAATVAARIDGTWNRAARGGDVDVDADDRIEVQIEPSEDRVASRRDQVAAIVLQIPEGGQLEARCLFVEVRGAGSEERLTAAFVSYRANLAVPLVDEEIETGIEDADRALTF